MDRDIGRRPETFVVRVARNAAGDLAGLVRHVRTGERRRFEGLASLGAAIGDMVRDDGDAAT